MHSIDAAYCYRRSSVVCQCVCVLVTTGCAAKTDELIEMPFGGQTHVVSRKETLYQVEVYIGAGWRIQLIRCATAAKRPCVKLL